MDKGLADGWRGQAVPQGPILHHALWSALPGCPEPVPGKLGCPSALSWKLGGTLKRDRTNVPLPWDPGWIAGPVMGDKQTGRGAEQRWAPVPVGTWHCMALPTFGAFCIIKDFAALAAVLLEQSF